ncbi:hypothetical protein [Nocardia sp. NPDC003963]
MARRKDNAVPSRSGRGRARAASIGMRVNRRRASAGPAGGRRRFAGTDIGSIALALLACVLLGAGVADISHSAVWVITAVVGIATGLVLTLAILRSSS